MVIILRKKDLKLVSVSKKKFIAYESIYISPLSFTSSKLKTCLEERFENVDQSDADAEKAKHVLSIKSVSSHSIPTPGTSAVEKFRPPTALDDAADSQTPSQGEGPGLPST